MKAVNSFFRVLPKNIRKFVGRSWFEYISRLDLGADLNFINYGYADLEPNNMALILDPQDEKDRFSIQHYHHLAKNINWTGLNALEIGCGRGGGAVFLTKYFKPNSYIGMDITFSAIEFCKKHYAINGLSFEVGDAENLRFADNSMDVIINVESSGNYPNIRNFFAEVARVLKPKGYFLYTDFRKKENMDSWRNQLDSMGFDLLKEEVISSNVLKSIDLSEERKKELVEKYSPRLLHGIVREFAGMRESNYVYESLKTGDKIYKSFIFRKPDNKSSG